MCWWEHGGWDELGWDWEEGGGEGRGTVLWICRIGFKKCAFVLKLQVPRYYNCKFQVKLRKS